MAQQQDDGNGRDVLHIFVHHDRVMMISVSQVSRPENAWEIGGNVPWNE